MSSTRTYTEEQAASVRRISLRRESGSSFYEILDVHETAGDAEIRQAYKTLARQVHPDKNAAPGATEAFQMVEQAVGVLTDEDRRRKYDRERRIMKTRTSTFFPAPAPPPAPAPAQPQASSGGPGSTSPRGSASTHETRKQRRQREFEERMARQRQREEEERAERERERRRSRRQGMVFVAWFCDRCNAVHLGDWRNSGYH